MKTINHNKRYWSRKYIVLQMSTQERGARNRACSVCHLYTTNTTFASAQTLSEVTVCEQCGSNPKWFRTGHVVHYIVYRGDYTSYKFNCPIKCTYEGNRKPFGTCPTLSGAEGHRNRRKSSFKTVKCVCRLRECAVYRIGMLYFIYNYNTLLCVISLPPLRVNRSLVLYD